MITNSRESTLDKLVEELCDQMEAGKLVELDSLVEQYPEMADRLHVIYPMVLAMANWSASDTKFGTPQIDFPELGNRELGDFQILRHIGRGGMGVVYEAQQLSIKRKVALKVLPFASLVDSRALQRFKNEVTAIATLEHPHIVSVYSVGEDRGIHYFAMQLVRGQSLGAVIRELKARAEQEQQISGEAVNQAISDIEKQKSAQHGNSSQSSRSQEIEEFDETIVHTVARGRSTTVRNVGDTTYFRNIAKLIRQTAEALQHAHDHGIVHRDVKPGNLLLDSNGTLFVADFGLARIEAGAGVTMTGDVLGTLRYMSPEQVLAGRVVIDHRTDIYSLGATLYELLTLQPMWPGENRAELIRNISSEEPIQPRKINAAIPPDLETIVLKATNQNSGDRYNSAQAFADDLNCFLDHKPIVAKRSTLIQRLSKWSQRHPTVVWATSLLMLVLTIGSAISAGLIWSANIDAQRQAHRAETNLDRVLDAVDDFLWRVGESGLENIPAAEGLRKKLLQDALAICQTLIDEEGQSPQVQLRTAGARASLASIHMELGDDDAAQRELIQAIDEFNDLIKRYPDHGIADRGKLELVGAYRNLGALFSGIGQREKGAEHYQRALEIERAISGSATGPENARRQLLRGMTYANLASAMRELNREQEAETACREAVRILKTLVDRYPDEPDYRIRLGWAHKELAAALDTQQKSGEAAANYDQAISILKQWNDESSRVPWARSILGATLMDKAVLVYFNRNLGEKDQVEPLLNDSISIFAQLARQFPRFPEYRVSLMRVQLQLAGVYRETNRIPKSIETLRQAIPIQRSLVEDFPARPDYRAELAKLLADYGGMLGMSTAGQEGGDATNESIEHFEILVRDFPEVPDYRLYAVMIYYNVGNGYVSEGRQKDAEAAFKKAITFAVPLVDQFPDTPRYRSQLVTVYSSRGSNLMDMDRFEAAREHLEFALNAIEQLNKEYPANSFYHEQRLGVQFSLAAVRSNLGEHEKGERLFKEYLSQMEALIQRNPSNPVYRSNYAAGHGNLALTFSAINRLELAAEHLAKALQIVQGLLERYRQVSVRQDIAKYASQLIEVHSELGDSEQALLILNDTIAPLKDFIEQHPENELFLERLGDIADLAARLGEATLSKQLLQHGAVICAKRFGEEHELTIRFREKLADSDESLKRQKKSAG